ncbi:NYN domain-containing protein [candidate division KSB1 bacterium]|nr:NYN domain-containing protein [candidate division KSB1 bacterium]
MNPIFIIDGYNVIHTINQLKAHLRRDLEAARLQLESMIRNYQALKKVSVYLVYDGAKIGWFKPAHSKNFKILFSHSNEEADALIKRLIAQFSGKRQLIVVTRDQDILKFAQSKGADTIAPQEFFHRITKREPSVELSKKYDASMSQDELQEWMDIFEIHHKKKSND